MRPFVQFCRRYWGFGSLLVLFACQQPAEVAPVPEPDPCPVKPLAEPALHGIKGWLFDRPVDFVHDSLNANQRVVSRDTLIFGRPTPQLVGIYTSLSRITFRSGSGLIPNLERVERVGIQTPSTAPGNRPDQFPGILATLFCPRKHLFWTETGPWRHGFAVEYISFGPGLPDLDLSTVYGPQPANAYFEIVETSQTTRGYLCRLRVRCYLYDRRGQLGAELRDTEIAISFFSVNLQQR
jgi:hypothetical protein